MVDERRRERSQELAGRARMNLLTIQGARQALNLGRLCRSSQTQGLLLTKAPQPLAGTQPLGYRESLPFY